MDGKRKTVTTHTLVYNEDRWIYFSLLSVIDYVDRMIIYDTGSTDKTADIIRYVMNLKSEYAQKIYFEETFFGKQPKLPDEIYINGEKQSIINNTYYFKCCANKKDTGI